MSERLTVEALRARFSTSAPSIEDFPSTPIPTSTPGPSFRKAAAKPEAKPDPVRPNRYAASCVRCSVWIPAEAGALVKKDDGGWGAQHIDPCPENQPVPAVAPVAAVPGQAVITSTSGQVYEGVHPGIYTLERSDGSYRTLRVIVQSTDADFAPGATILEYLTGPDNQTDYKGFAFLKGSRLVPWKRYRENFEPLLADAAAFLADPEASLQAKNCIRCHAVLSTPDSLARGMGPVCSERGW